MPSGVQIATQRGKGGLRLGVAAGLLLRQGDFIRTGVDALAGVLIIGDGLQDGNGLAVSARLLQRHAPRIGTAVRRQPVHGGSDDGHRHQCDERNPPLAQFPLHGGVVFRHIFSSFGQNTLLILYRIDTEL